MEIVGTVSSLFLGLGLAASVGFRVFLPLLVLSIAAHFDVLPMGESWQWVGSFPAMISLGFATVLEILGYYIPWFDNTLDAVAMPVAAVAGTAVMASTAVDIEPMWKWALAVIAGGGTASVVKGSNAGTRMASTSTTGGLGNPLVATFELLASGVLSLLSIYLWPLAAVLTIILLITIFFIWRSVRKKFFKRT